MGNKKGMGLKIGFIGQGWIGKNYADDFEKRGYDVVRYGLEEPHIHNGDRIKECDIVFIAVPTPSTPQGFDASILRQAIKKVGAGKIAVIKSTLLPGTTEEIQKANPDIFVFHSPEFLTEATAAHDAAHPKRNIIGYAIESDEYKEMAKLIMSVLPKAPFGLICRAKEAEFIKYGGNNWFYFKVVFVNLLYDLAKKSGCDYDIIREGMAADPRVGFSHLIPVHKSGTPGGDAYQLQTKKDEGGGRGAGGHCFIKDFAAFREMYEKVVGDEKGVALLGAMEEKNIDLLLKSGKDLDLLAGVYGESVVGGKKTKTGKAEIFFSDYYNAQIVLLSRKQNQEFFFRTKTTIRDIVQNAIEGLDVKLISGQYCLDYLYLEVQASRVYKLYNLGEIIRELIDRKIKEGFNSPGHLISNKKSFWEDEFLVLPVIQGTTEGRQKIINDFLLYVKEGLKNIGELKRKKVVVTGGAGFIGSNLVDSLIEQGNDVVVIDNLSTGKRENVNPKAKLNELDIRHLEKIKPLFEGADYVFHLAAFPRVQPSIEDPATANDINLNGTLNVLIAARDAKVKKVIYSASSSAYGNQEKMPLVEDMPASPLSPYGLQKYVGELYCRLFSEIYGLPTISLRYFNVYGPRQALEGAYTLVMGIFVRQRLNNEPMTITNDGEQRRDFTSVVDVVRANMLAATSDKAGKGEVINIGRGKNYSVNELARMIGGPVKFIGERIEPRVTLADNRKAKELLGWEPTMDLPEWLESYKKEFGLV